MMTVGAQTAAALAHLSNWAAGLTWDALPDDIRARVGLVFVDDFGALAAARAEPELIALRARLAVFSGPPEALVHDGAGQRLDRYSAALANGAGADWCELDGGYRRAVCHAALYCLPALMAEAEAAGQSVRDALVALVAGYEVVARVARTYEFPALTMHPHGGLATIGAAVAVARLRGLDGARMLAAVNAAAALVVPGPFNHAVEGALMRNVWPGVCAQNGLRAVDWVGMGILGGANALHEVFAVIFGARSVPDHLQEGLGQDFTLRDGYHKMHACCQYSHSTVEAMLGALAGGRAAPDKVRAITVCTHAKGMLLDNAQPATTLAAKFSIQHIAAATLAFGHAGAEAFHADTLRDPVLMRLRGLVAIAAHGPELAPPNDRPARVQVILADGQVLEAECLSAQGGADRPSAPQQIIDKAVGNLRAGWPRLAGQAAELAGAQTALLDQSLSDLLMPG